MSLKLGLYRNKNKNCQSLFRKDLPPPCHSENKVKNELLNELLQPKLSQIMLERETAFKKVYYPHKKNAENKQLDHSLTETGLNADITSIGQKVLLENQRKDLSKK